MPNKGVQGTLHKVSGPLTPDVGQRKMKCRFFTVVVIALLLSGCAPTLIRYKHVVVTESATVKVLERSSESNDSQGKPLSGQIIGLPTKSVLTGSNYIVTIFTPVNSSAVVFLRADDHNMKALDLRGAHLRQLEKKSGMGLQGYRYSFIVDEANGGSMEFDVVSEQGSVLGHENIKYDVVSRGYVWVINSI